MCKSSCQILALALVPRALNKYLDQEMRSIRASLNHSERIRRFQFGRPSSFDHFPSDRVLVFEDGRIVAPVTEAGH